MVSIDKKKDCCGCKACEQACPLKCIKMIEDNEGFWYPHVDLSNCISCNKCEKVCPIKNKSNNANSICKTYAGQSLDEKLVKKSSSGAIFAELALGVIKQGGVVIGAAFDDSYTVKHICIEKEDDLYRLQGSKYVQSDINNTFKQAESFLINGRKVLFSGTACQVSGLKKYLAKEYDNLISVDVLCHGVPSPLAWKKYIAEMAKGSPKENVAAVSFREKRQEYPFYFRIDYKNGTSFSEPVQDNLFMKLFIRNFSLRLSCYSCKFKDLQRDSDITLGDCWTAGKSIPELKNKKSISVIIAHTVAGEDIIKSLTDRICLFDGNVDLLLPPDEDSRKSVRPNLKRKAFFNALVKYERFSDLAKFEKPSLIRRIYWKIKK